MCSKSDSRNRAGSVEWVVSAALVLDDTTNAFQPRFGPKDQRVLLRANAKKNVAKKPIKLALFTGSCLEQVT